MCRGKELKVCTKWDSPQKDTTFFQFCIFNLFFFSIFVSMLFFFFFSFFFSQERIANSKRMRYRLSTGVTPAVITREPNSVSDVYHKEITEWTSKQRKGLSV
jgi:hypothetical protein